MTGINTISSTSTADMNGSSFPSNLEIPESAINDRKFLSSYVRIFNDPRFYKRQRLNGDRTSSRFEVDYNCQINVVFNEPVLKRKSILLNAENSKEKTHYDSGTRKSVSFLSKITVIDINDLEGGSSEWSDIENDEIKEKAKPKSKKTKKRNVISHNGKKKTTNGIPSTKNHKKKSRDTSSKKAQKIKSPPKIKELFKIKITKPFRKYGRSKQKKLKNLQKKFGRRMFKSFVNVKRSFNLKDIPEKLCVPLQKITMKKVDSSIPGSVSSIQDFLVGKVTTKVKVVLTSVPVSPSHTNEIQIKDKEITDSDLIKSSEVSTQNTLYDIRIDNQIDMNGTKESINDNQSVEVLPSEGSNTSHESIQINGDAIKGILNRSSEMTTLPYKYTEPSLELTSNPLTSNGYDEKARNMWYSTNNDETATVNGQINDVDNISSLNVSFSMPSTNAYMDNHLGCDVSFDVGSRNLDLLND